MSCLRDVREAADHTGRCISTSCRAEGGEVRSGSHDLTTTRASPQPRAQDTAVPAPVLRRMHLPDLTPDAQLIASASDARKSRDGLDLSFFATHPGGGCAILTSSWKSIGHCQDGPDGSPPQHPRRWKTSRHCWH